jgi:hypothetical protein
MAFITDYATLVRAMQDFAHRDEIKPYIDYFIQGASEAIQNDVFDQNEGAGLRFQEVEFPATDIDGTTGTVPVPADYLSPKLLTVTVAQAQFLLQQKSAQWIFDRYPTRAPDGVPTYIARDGSNFIFGPFPDSTYTVQGTYYAIATPISTANSVNWMTENCPLVLFSACMIEVGKFLLDNDMQQQWTQTYGQRLKAMIDADRSERWSNATMQIDLG